MVNANQGDATTILGLVQQNECDNQHQDVDKQLEWNDAKELEVRYKLEVLGETTNSLVALGLGERRDEQRQTGVQEAAAQGNNHCLHSAVRNQEARKRAASNNQDKGNAHGAPDRKTKVLPANTNGDGRQTNQRRNLDVDAASNHNKRYKKRDHKDWQVVVNAGKQQCWTQELAISSTKNHKLKHKQANKDHVPACLTLGQESLKCLHH